MKYITILLSLALASCGTSQFSRGEFEDSQKVNLLNDRFSESHAQAISKDLVASLIDKNSKCSIPKNRVPFIGIKGIKNSTEEQIDSKLITDQMEVALNDSGRFRFVSLEAREQLEEEATYSDSGLVSKASLVQRGSQQGVDYLLVGDLHGNVQMVGKNKTSYYYIKVSLINTKTGVADCSVSTEKRSAYEKHRE